MFDSQDETSEQFIGEWMETRGIRDQMVIATKVSGDSIRLVLWTVALTHPNCSIRQTSSAVARTSNSTRATSGTT